MNDQSKKKPEPGTKEDAAQHELEAGHGPPDSARLPRANRSVHGQPQQPEADSEVRQDRTDEGPGAPRGREGPR